MTQLLLTQRPDGWHYALLLDGVPVLTEGPYDTVADAAVDAAFDAGRVDELVADEVPA